MSRTNTKPDTGVAWKAPPSSKRPDWTAVADELRAHPGKWMLVYEHGNYSWSNAIWQGHNRAMHRDLGFEIRTTDTIRGTPRTNTMYARFNPNRVDALAEIIARGKRTK